VVPTGDAAVFAFGILEGSDSGQTDGEIHTVRADGTDLRRLTDGPGLRSVPSWSPDGTRIAYRLWTNGADSVEVIDAGGGDLRTLATNAQANQYCLTWSLAWSPDGSSLIFPTRDGCTGDYSLSVVATDGSSAPVALLAADISSLNGRWSPDGTQIAFLGKERNGSVGTYVIDDVSPAEALVGGLEARRIGPDLGSSLDEGMSGPRWSPDGTELLVAGTGPSVAGNAIWAIMADGSSERLVAGDATNPNWSPDGTHIAFHRFVDPAEYFNNRPCTVRTWIVDATGANEHALDIRADPCGYEPLWSPDGSRIVDSLYVAALDETEATFHLGIRSVDGDKVTAILPDGSAGSWQPVAAPLPPAPSFPGASPTT
jgi:Tol biopolymer transport system component